MVRNLHFALVKHNFRGANNDTAFWIDDDPTSFFAELKTGKKVYFFKRPDKRRTIIPVVMINKESILIVNFCKQNLTEVQGRERVVIPDKYKSLFTPKKRKKKKVKVNLENRAVKL